MQIVIDIPKTAYEYFVQGLRYTDDVEMAIIAIVDGTPLPKGHGDLIDKKEITAFRELECNGHDIESLDEFTVIIEADTESEGTNVSSN